MGKPDGEPLVSTDALSALAHAALAERIGKDRRRGLFVDGSRVDRSLVASREQARANRRTRRLKKRKP